MTIVPKDLLKILLAIVAGGLVGAEREFRDRAAGFRTLIFIKEIRQVAAIDLLLST